MVRQESLTYRFRCEIFCFTLASSFLAQMNSVVRIASPRGIKINAGLGSVNIKMPRISEVKSVAAIIIILMDFKVGFN